VSANSTDKEQVMEEIISAIKSIKKNARPIKRLQEALSRGKVIAENSNDGKDIADALKKLVDHDLPTEWSSVLKLGEDIAQSLPTIGAIFRIAGPNSKRFFCCPSGPFFV